VESGSELDNTTTDLLDTSQNEAPSRDGVRFNYDDQGNINGESTHLMAAEQLEDGNWVGFPRLFQDSDGSWVDKTKGPWEDAYDEAKIRGEVKEFGENKESALAYGEGSWKMTSEKASSNIVDLEAQLKEQYDTPEEKDPFANTLLSDEVIEDPFELSLKSSVNADMIKKEEEFVVPEMNYKFGRYGFKFVKEDWMGDEMRVIADNKKELEVELDRLWSKESTAKELETFLRDNKVEPSNLNRIVQEEKDILRAVKVFNKETESLVSEFSKNKDRKKQLENYYIDNFSYLSQNQIDENPNIRDNYEGWLNAKEEIESESVKLSNELYNFTSKGYELDILAGKYVEMQRKQGGYFGGLGNAALTGVGRMVASVFDASIDIMTYAPNRNLGEEMYLKEIIRVAREQGNIPEEYQEEGKLESLSKDELVEALGGDTNDMAWVANTFNKLALGVMSPISFREAMSMEGQIKETAYDKANAKVMDLARKSEKEYGSYEEAVKGRYRNPLSDAAFNMDTSVGLLDYTRDAFRRVYGDDNVTEAWNDAQTEGFWGGAILGVAESLPAMVVPGGFAVRTAAMYAQVSDHVMEEMEENPAFDNISESEKAMVKMPIGIAVGTLESLGFRNVLNQKGFLNKIVATSLGKVIKNTKSVAPKSFGEFIRQDVENMLLRGVLTISAAGIAEFETGAAQEVADISVKQLYNLAKESEMFDTPKTFTDYASQVLIAGAQELVGGMVLGSPSAVVNSISGLDVQNLDDKTYEIFEKLIQDSKLKTMYVTKLKQRIADPENDTDLNSAKKELEIVNQLEGLLQNGQIPESFTIKKKKETLQLLYQKNELENEIGPQDKVLSKPKQDLLNKVNDALSDITEQSISERENISVDATKIKDLNQEETEAAKDSEEKSDVTTEESGDIESFFEGKVTEDKEQKSPNLSINRTNSPELSSALNAEKNRIIKIATLGARSVAKFLPNLKIILHESNDEYSKYAAADGRAEINGDVIHVNLSKALKTTVPHEIFHAILIDKIGSDADIQRATERMMISVSKSLASDSGLKKRIDDFAARYTEKDENGKTIPAKIQNEERLAELIGILSSEEGRNLNKPTKNIIIQWIKDIARKFGVKIGSDFGKKDSDVIDLLNTIAKKTKTGEEIEKADIKTLEGLGGQEKGDNTIRNQLSSSESDAISKSVVDKTVKGKTIPTLLQFKKEDKEEILYFEGEINQKNVRDNIPQSYNTTATKLIQYNVFGIDTKEFLELSLENASKKDINKKLDDNKKVLDKKIISLRKEIAKIKAGKKLTKSEKEPLIGQRVESIKIIKDIKRSKDLSEQLTLLETVPHKTYLDSLYNSMFYNVGDGLKKLSTQELLKRSDKIYRKAKDIVKSNLLSVYNSVSPTIRKISKLWYDGANLIAQEMSSKYNVTLEQAAAIIATQSPQKKWFDNLHLADVIMDIMKNQADSLFTEEMFNYYVSKSQAYPNQKKYIPTLKNQIGKKLSELSDYDASIFIRVDYDLNISRKAPIRIPTGTAVNESETGDSSFSGYEVITKGVSVYRDGSMSNISNQLGRANKVRNFYLNIADPSDKRAVTIDTHAMAIALFKPLASNDIEVDFNAASFSFYADAYRELAEELGIEARALQSITWEAARAIFPAKQKAKAGYKEKISGIWDGFKSGENTIEQVQKEIFNQAGDVNITQWSKYINELKNETKRKNVSGRIIRSDGTKSTDNLGDFSVSNSGIPGTRRGLTSSNSESNIKNKVQSIEGESPKNVVNTVRKQRGLITLSEQEVLKYARAGIESQYDSQAIKQIGLQGVKFTKEDIQDKIKESLDKLIKNSDSYIMSEDSKAVDGAIQYEINTLINDGASEAMVENAKKAFEQGAMRESFIDSYKKAQKETLEQWKSYLSQSDYSDSFKYLMLDAVLTNNYDFKTNKYTKRTNKTIRNFTPFDAGTLAALYANNSKSLLKDYVEIQAENASNIIESSSFVSTKEGEWIKFDGGKSVSPEIRLENANKLSQIVQNTYWCTKTNANSQLKDGDFYVYATKDSNGEYESRIAVRMEGDKVGEVRGNASSKQDLEADMMPVADKFLKENIPNGSGQKWLNSIEYNTKVKELTEKIEGVKINEELLKEYFDIIKDADKFKVDYGENGLVTKLKNVFDGAEFNFPVARNLRELRPNTFLFIGNFIPISQVKSNIFPKYITGNANFWSSNVTDLGNLTSIEGNADFVDSQITDLGSLQSIGGGVYFGYSKITDLGSLNSIGGDANFVDSQVADLGNLKSIGGRGNFKDSKVTDLGNLTSIGGNADFKDSKVADLGNLTSIGGNADFKDSKVADLGSLQSIGGRAYFGGSKITDLGDLQSIGGFANFSDSQITDLGGLKSIGGYANFVDSKVADLGDLQSIGRRAYFGGSKITDLGSLKSIGGIASFGNNIKLEEEWNNRKSKTQTRQQKTISDVARFYNINQSGFFPSNVDVYKLRKAIEAVGYGIKKSKTDQYGRGGNYFPVNSKGVKVNPLSSRTRQQKSIASIIIESRENNFREPVIRDYLVRMIGFSAKEVDKLMEVNVDLLSSMPKSFGAIKGGTKIGISLFKKVEDYRTKLIKNNNRRVLKNQISEQEIIDKTIEFLEKQKEYINESDTYSVGSVKKGTKETKNRKGLSTQQASMLSDLQKSIGIRPTENMASKLRMARLIVNQRKKGAKDIDNIRRELRNFLRKSLPKSLYDKPQVIAIINNINAANLGNIENVFKVAEEFVITQNVKDLKRKLKTILNGKFNKVESGRRKANRVDNETRKRIENIKRRLLDSNATDEDIDAANELLMKEFNDLLNEPNQTNEQRQIMVDLQLIMDYNSLLLMSDSDSNKVIKLDSIVSTLQEILDFGRSMLKEQIKQSYLEYQRQFEIGYETITGEKVDMSDKKKAKKELDAQRFKRENDAERKRKTDNVLKQFFNKLSQNLTTIFSGTAEALDGLMDKIDILPGEMFGGNLQEMFTDRVDESSRTYKGRMMAVEGLIHDYLLQTLGKNWRRKSRKMRDMDKNVFIYRDADAKKNNRSEILSQNQMGYYYNMAKDPLNNNALEATFGKEWRRVVNEIELNLSDDTKSIADWQVDILYPSLYEYYNSVYKKIHRTDLPLNQFYAGTVYREGVEYEGIDMLGNNSSMYNTSISPGATKQRQNSSLPIKNMDMLDVLSTYITEMEYFSAYAETIRDMDKFFKNRYIVNAIKSIHGDGTMRFIDEMITKISTKGGQSAFGDKWINNMSNAFIVSRLSVSPVIMIKQLTSTFTYANDIGFLNWIKYAAKNKTEQVNVWKEVRDNSVYMKDRANDSILKSIETYSQEGMKSFVSMPAKEWIVNFMMWTTKFGDRTAIMVGGLPNYSFYKADFKSKKPNATEQEAIDYAIRKFERDTKRTQQSSDLQDKDYYQTKNPIYRALNMFMTTPKQYLRKEIQASRSLFRKLKAWDKKAGKGTITENVRTLIMYHIFMPTLFQYVSLGLPGLLRGWRDDDDDDLYRAAILGNLNALFLVGEIFSFAADALQGKPWAGSIKLGSLQVFSGIAKKYIRASKTKDPVKRANHMMNFYLEVATLTGTPAPTIKKFAENYSKLGQGDEDFGISLMRFLNYSKYQIEGPAPKGSTAKPKTTQEINEKYNKQQKRLEKEKLKNETDFMSGGFGEEGFGSGGFNNDGFN